MAAPKMEVPNSMYDNAAPMQVGVPVQDVEIGQPTGSGMSVFQNQAISVEQTMRGCLQECCGCEVRVYVSLVTL